MRSIHVKYVLAYLLVVVAIFFSFNWAGTRLLEDRLVQQREDALYREATLISENYMNNYFSDQITLPYLNTQLQSIDTFLDVRIWIVNPDSALLLDTRSQVSQTDPPIIADLTEDFLSRRFAEHVRISGYLTQESIAVILPVSRNYSIQGYILLFSSYDTITQFINYYLDTVNIICLILFIVFFILLFLFDLGVLLPLKKITRAAGEFAAGHYEHKLKPSGSSEFHQLAQSVSFLANRIQNLEEYQQKFISNISHDFRSPLTSIRGYTQAMLDGTIPPEMQEKYLSIVLFETERLTKLTDNLLELNTVQGGANIHRSTFDINAIIRQTAASFEGTCEKKRITIKLTFDEEETLVFADLGKIQQVLYNLLDNAIKFSNNNSSIQIRTEIRNNKLYVSVKDSGIGIPQDSINKIWDRFYKTDLSRGKDKKGTGLGLSIVKEIIQAHGENINVISTEGAGSEFIFSLSFPPED